MRTSTRIQPWTTTYDAHVAWRHSPGTGNDQVQYKTRPKGAGFNATAFTLSPDNGEDNDKPHL